MPLQSSIAPTADGYYELTLEGHIHRPHWIIQLFSALSQSKISIISGDARQDKPGQWTSRFVLDFRNSSTVPQHLDYAALSEQAPTAERPAALPKVTHFEIARLPDQMIQLRIEGPDQMGFLASILGRASGLALFPSVLEIRTVAGKIKDVIILRGIGDRGPSEAAYDSLHRMLKVFMGHTATHSPPTT